MRMQQCPHLSLSPFTSEFWEKPSDKRTLVKSSVSQTWHIVVSFINENYSMYLFVRLFYCCCFVLFCLFVCLFHHGLFSLICSVRLSSCRKSGNLSSSPWWPVNGGTHPARGRSDDNFLWGRHRSSLRANPRVGRLWRPNAVSPCNYCERVSYSHPQLNCYDLIGNRLW